MKLMVKLLIGLWCIVAFTAGIAMETGHKEIGASSTNSASEPAEDDIFAGLEDLSHTNTQGLFVDSNKHAQEVTAPAYSACASASGHDEPLAAYEKLITPFSGLPMPQASSSHLVATSASASGSGSSVVAPNLGAIEERRVPNNSDTSSDNVRSDKRLQTISQVKRDADGNFRCPDPNCTYKAALRQRYNIQRHWEVVHNNSANTVSCDQCTASFANRQKLAIHKNSHASLLKSASASASGSGSAQGHIDSENDATTHNDVQSSVNNSSSDAQKNVSSIEADSNGRFHCFDKDCPFRANLKRNVHVHWETIHNNNARYSCDLCTASFFTKSGLVLHQNSHILLSHPESKVIVPAIEQGLDGRFLCPDKECSHRSDTKNAIKSHWKAVHNNSANTMSCDQCTASFSSQSALTVHKNSHASSLPSASASASGSGSVQGHIDTDGESTAQSKAVAGSKRKRTAISEDSVVAKEHSKKAAPSNTAASAAAQSSATTATSTTTTTTHMQQLLVGVPTSATVTQPMMNIPLMPSGPYLAHAIQYPHYAQQPQAINQVQNSISLPALGWPGSIQSQSAVINPVAYTYSQPAVQYNTTEFQQALRQNVIRQLAMLVLPELSSAQPAASAQAGILQQPAPSYTLPALAPAYPYPLPTQGVYPMVPGAPR